MKQRLESFLEARRALERFISPPAADKRAYGPQRMRALMEFLGNPQNSYKTVHVAGTSGKTSTAYYLANMLRAADCQVGLTISPHVDEINERVQFNGKPLGEIKFCKELSAFLALVDKSTIRPTYFEAVTAFAFWEFARLKVDYAVVEVGIGGLLDATNCIRRDDKICIITDIGLDHTEALGKTLPEIASQKAGIIKPHNTVFTYEQNDEIMQVLREVCEQQQAELHEIWALENNELPRNLPLFQRRNWYLAWTVQRFLTERDKLKDLSEKQLASSTELYVPARMESVTYGGKTLIMDGAHNAQKLAALVKSIQKKYPKQKVAVLAGFIQTKQVLLQSDLEALLPIMSHLITTSFKTEGAPKDSIQPLKIIEACEIIGFNNWEIADEPRTAFKKLLKREEPVLLITGSFYLLNHIRPLVRA